MARIEFLGVPGAGKTSLASAAIDDLVGSGVDAVDLNEAVYRALRADTQDPFIGPLIQYLPYGSRRRTFKRLAARSQDRLLALRAFMLEEPDAAIAILSALRDRGDIDPRQDLAFGWIVELLWTYQVVSKSEANSHALLVLDEGFCNRALTLFGYRFSEEDLGGLSSYINSIPAPDLVIVVGTDDDRAALRATQRTRFRHLTDVEAVDYTRDVAKCVSATTELLVERGIEVRDVQNDGSLADASRAVRTLVREWNSP